MKATTPENRPPAPGALRVVQEFMNSGHLAAKGIIPEAIAGPIRARRAAGESQATLAAEYGLSQALVAALGRGARTVDDLGTAERAAGWLVARDLLPAGSSLTQDDLATLHELRELLRALALANNGEEIDPGVLPALDRMASTAPLALRFDAVETAALQPAGEGVTRAVGGLLAIVHEAMREGTFQRLKRCPGNGCPHSFYDASRNRTGTWCSMSVCGNRTKVRSYQSRRRAAHAGRLA
jgi:predicted RNA-binding Zn ribbon-like protein